MVRLEIGTRGAQRLEEVMASTRSYNGVHLSAGLTNTPFALTGTASAV
jgi:hypothetical protein